MHKRQVIQRAHVPYLLKEFIVVESVHQSMYRGRSSQTLVIFSSRDALSNSACSYEVRVSMRKIFQAQPEPTIPRHSRNARAEAR